MKTVVFDDARLLALYPEGIKVHAESAAECIQAIQQYPGLRADDCNGFLEVHLPDFQSKDAIYAPTELETIRVCAVESGAGGGGKNGSFMQIVIGIILIVVSYFFPPAYAAWGSAFFAAGVSLTLGGVVALLMPQPDAASLAGDSARSNYLPANQNTVKAGTRIPLLYGRCKAYGHVLSFNVTAGDFGNPAKTTPAEVPGGYEAMVDINFNFDEYDWSN